MTASARAEAGRLPVTRGACRWLWLLVCLPLVPLFPLDPAWYLDGALIVQWERLSFDRPCDPVSGDTIIEQRIRSQRWDSVTAVSLRFGTYCRVSSGVLRVEVSRPGQSPGSSDSAVARVDLADLQDNQWVMIRFERVLPPGEGPLTVRIASECILPGNEVTVWRDVEGCGETGNLMMNGVGIPGELALKLWTRKPVPVILLEALDRSGPARLIGGKLARGIVALIGLLGLWSLFRLLREVRRI